MLTPDETGNRADLREITAHELSEAWTAAFPPGAFARRRPFPWSKGMPLADAVPPNLEAWAAMVLPWWAEPRDESFLKGYVPVSVDVRVDMLGGEILPLRVISEFRGVLEGYRYFSMPAPEPFTVERWFRDFHIVDGGGFRLPQDVAAILHRHTGEADATFVQAAGPGFAVGPTVSFELFGWAVERRAFFELREDVVPVSFGIIEIFPQGGQWYLVYDDDYPLLNLGGSRELLTELEETLGDRMFRRSLDDPLYL